MPRGQRKEIQYEGKALRLHEKVIKLESELKAVKEERDAAYKEYLAAKKATEKKAKQDAIAAAKKAAKEREKEILNAIKKSRKTPEEILAFIVANGTSVIDETKQEDIVQ